MSKIKIDLLLDIECGSSFQEDFISKIFEPVLKGIKMQYENAHQKNKLDYTIVKNNQAQTTHSDVSKRN